MVGDALITFYKSRTFPRYPVHPRSPQYIKAKGTKRLCIDRSSTMEEEPGKKTHVMLLPSMGRGHIIPTVRLALDLADHGLSASVVLTSDRADTAKTLITQEHQQKQKPPPTIYEIKLPQEQLSTLPDAKTSSNSVAPHTMPPLFTANINLEAPFRAFLSDHLANHAPPLCIIADFLLGWATTVGNDFGIRRVCLDICGMYTECLQIILWDVLPRNLPRSPSGRLMVGMPGNVRLTERQVLPELLDGTTETGRYKFFSKVRPLNKQSGFTLVNTFYEMESESVDHFANVNAPHPLRCIGPLLPKHVFVGKKRGASDGHGEGCMKWLDAQPDESVLYVSFGSENSITRRQMGALALGLESCGVKFIWVVRPPKDTLPGSVNPDFLPEGFVKRVTDSGQGFVVKTWAPQVSILCHPATGGFVSHCGWNSILEAVSTGVPLIAWPLFAEQHLNSKFVVDEVGIALEAPQRVDDEWFVSSEEVAGLVKELMCGESGRAVRAKVKELRAKASSAVSVGGSSYNGLKDFVAHMLSQGAANSGK